MEIQYLGTSASECVPAVFCECDMCNEARRRGGRDLRTRACTIIDGKVMMDFGPEIYVQSVRFGVHLSEMRYLLITHPHGDHLCTSNIGLRGGFWGMKLKEDVLDVYGGKEACEAVRKSSSNPIITPHYRINQIAPFETVDVGDYRFTALRASHAKTLECFLYLIESKADGKKVLYMHDTDRNIDDTVDFLKGTHCDLVSFDCTNGNDFFHGEGHMGLKDNILLRERLIENGVVDSSTICTCSHICHHVGLYDDLARIADHEGFLLAYDGIRITI